MSRMVSFSSSTYETNGTSFMNVDITLSGLRRNSSKIKETDKNTQAPVLISCIDTCIDFLFNYTVLMGDQYFRLFILDTGICEYTHSICF